MEEKISVNNKNDASDVKESKENSSSKNRKNNTRIKGKTKEKTKVKSKTAPKRVNKEKIKYNVEDLEQVKKDEQVLEMFVEKVDESYNMIGYVGNNIKAILPREESSSITEEDGLVATKHIVNKEGKKVQVCIKEIIQENGETVVIASKKILELKVRKWMYMYLKPGMKMRGVVRGLTDYAAFVDVGGGVTGMLKLSSITDVPVNSAKDVLRLGERVHVIVTKYDRDTGKIELSYKDVLPSFEEMTKDMHEGDIIEGTVRVRGKNAMYIELKPNVCGISEHVNGLEYGTKVLVSVRKVNVEKKKVKVIIIG